MHARTCDRTRARAHSESRTRRRTLRGDPVVVLAAVAQTGEALRYASAQLRADRGPLVAEAQRLRDGGLLVAARQRLAFAAALALHDGFELAPRKFTLAAVPALAARPGADGRPCHPMRALVLDAAPRHLAGAHMPALAVVRRAQDQGWAWHDGGAPAARVP